MLTLFCTAWSGSIVNLGFPSHVYASSMTCDIADLNALQAEQDPKQF